MCASVVAGPSKSPGEMTIASGGDAPFLVRRLRQAVESGQRQCPFAAFVGADPPPNLGGPQGFAVGVDLSSFEDAILFNNIHEGIHLGYMMGVRKGLGGAMAEKSDD